MGTKIFPPENTNYPISNAHINSMEQYQEIYDESVADPESFLGKCC